MSFSSGERKKKSQYLSVSSVFLRHCTKENLFTVKGQNGIQVSRCGLTSAKYRGTITALVLLATLLLIKNIDIFILVVVVCIF